MTDINGTSEETVAAAPVSPPKVTTAKALPSPLVLVAGGAAVITQLSTILPSDFYRNGIPFFMAAIFGVCLFLEGYRHHRQGKRNYKVSPETAVTLGVILGLGLADMLIRAEFMFGIIFLGLDIIAYLEVTGTPRETKVNGTNDPHSARGNGRVAS